MAKSKAKTVADYLRELEPERRALIETVRDTVNANLPKGYEEGLAAGMIAWQVPLSIFPNTYNGHALWYVALAAQKNYNALYLMGAYGDPRQQEFLRQEFKKRGKKLDMGKSCLRFKNLNDLPLDVIGEVVRTVPPETLMAMHEQAHGKTAKKKSG